MRAFIIFYLTLKLTSRAAWKLIGAAVASVRHVAPFEDCAERLFDV